MTPPPLLLLLLLQFNREPFFEIYEDGVKGRLTYSAIYSPVLPFYHVGTVLAGGRLHDELDKVDIIC